MLKCATLFNPKFPQYGERNIKQIAPYCYFSLAFDMITTRIYQCAIKLKVWNGASLCQGPDALEILYNT